MEFIHQPYQPEETIAAIATPPGEGGVAIIRISGKMALQVAAKVFSGPVHRYKTHTAHYGKVLNHLGEVIDDVLLMPFLGRRSYTGEDTVEIFCHGGSLITRRVLETVLLAGARHALPGEFTFKAYINGRIDLAQAEAVQELIAAKNERALDAAENQLKGALSDKIHHFQKKLTTLAAILEAWVDFPEEGLEFSTMDELSMQLKTTASEMKKLLKTFHDGKIIREGISLCLVGSPNVGKSSLMNALLEKERAIVSHVPGTTRDVLEDHLYLNGLNFRLLDTAGIRETEEFIEQEGIRRSKQAMLNAELILFVLDASRGIGQEENQLLKELPREKTIAIWNKIDVMPPATELDFPYTVKISARDKLGLEDLKATIDSIIWQKGPPSREEVVLTNARHKEALKQAIGSLELVIQGLQTDVSPEFLTLDIRNALGELGKIIGSNIGEDILSEIFSRFCIGK
ncbi:tRNA modification GTPase MnmE [Chlamydiales bacterium STE3]|nr:tRNA modification GTPase MnmE [Chlamydiales bacterium STE3]